jgi:Flp pilus assembly protein TadD
LNRQHYNAIYDLGRLLLNTNRGPEALEYFQKAAKIKPDNPDVHYRLFRIYTRLKRKAEADQEFKLYKQLTDKTATSNTNHT